MFLFSVRSSAMLTTPRYLVCLERPITAQRQRTIFGTIWLCDCRIATAERAQRPLLHLRLRCPLSNTTHSSPLVIYNVRNTRCNCYGLHIFLYRLVITLESFKDRIRAQSEESWGAPDSCSCTWCFVLRLRKAAMVEISPSSGCRRSWHIYWKCPGL